MSGKNTYWITDADGNKAIVEGAAVRDEWVKLRGWADAVGEPAPTDQVHVIHETGMRGRLPYGAIAGGWDGLGWAPSDPPMPVDTTKDSASADKAAGDATGNTRAAAASGTVTKEK
jgi:hypothetical protein